jgi:RNA polymerase sigma factor (TIGR02999 family)
VLPDSVQVTTLLHEWRQGNAAAGERFLGLVYDELRHLATRYLRQERRDHTLQPTALVHELYLRLFASEPIPWQNRAHVFAVAAHTLRRILVDHARAEQSAKRGGLQLKVTFTGVQQELSTSPDHDVLVVNEALDRLAQLAPRAAQVVELRFFGGLEEKEVAEVLAVAPITVKRDWRFARAWLLTQFQPFDATDTPQSRSPQNRSE